MTMRNTYSNMSRSYMQFLCGISVDNKNKSR